MGITSTSDFGRFQTDQSDQPNEDHVLNKLDRGGDSEPAESFGLVGGVEPETADVQPPVAGPYVDGLGPNYLVVRDPQDDAPDNLDGHGKMNPPRHDRYAAENSGVVAERVVPYTATNANPSYDDGAAGIGASTPEVEPETVAEDQPPTGPPAKSAVKAEWVDYVVANYEITREEAEGLTKDQLVETYGE